MGYLVEKYKRVIKWPYYLYLKESLEIKKVVFSIRQLYGYIYVKIPKEVEVDHKIRQSLKDQEKAVKTALDGLNADYKMVINLTIEENKALDVIEKIENEWLKMRKELKKEEHNEIVKELRKIDIEFEKMMHYTMQEAEKEDKGAYNDILAIINAAKDEKTFMEKVKTYLKKVDISRLERWAGKFESRAVRKYLNSLESDEKKVKELIGAIESDLNAMNKRKKSKKRKKDLPEYNEAEHLLFTIKKLQDLLKSMWKHIAKEFYEAYKVIRRDLVLILILLRQLSDMQEEIKKWVEEKKEPSAPEKKNLQ